MGLDKIDVIGIELDVERVNADVTAGQDKSSEQKIAWQYACAPAGPIV